MNAARFMNPDSALLATYEEWRGWAQAEGDAIQAGDWARVARCQDALRQLQARLPAAAQAAQTEWLRRDADRPARERECRRIVSELIALETRNSALLADQRQLLQAQLNDLDRSATTLKRVQQSYAPERAPAWTSFS